MALHIRYMLCDDVQGDVEALQAELESLVSAGEADSTTFSTAYGQDALQQQEAALQQQQAEAEAEVTHLMQQLREKRQSLLQQQAAAVELKQRVQDGKAALADVRQLIAAESAASTELLTQLQEAEREGLAALQLLRLRQNLAGREDALLQQKCRWVAICMDMGLALFGLGGSIEPLTRASTCNLQSHLQGWAPII
jgi:HSP90 family molecular chaperone